MKALRVSPVWKLSYALALFMIPNVCITVCVDEPGWQTYDPDSVFSGITCSSLSQSPGALCDFFFFFPDEQSVTSYDACCVCKSVAPSSTPTVTPTYKPTHKPTITSRPSLSRATTSPSAAPTVCVNDPSYYVPLGDNQSYGCEVVFEDLCSSFHTLSDREGTMSPYDGCCECKGFIQPSSAPQTSGEPTFEPSQIPSGEPSFRPSREPSSPPSLEPTSP